VPSMLSARKRRSFIPQIPDADHSFQIPALIIAMIWHA
jgi:hypothetical protein